MRDAGHCGVRPVCEMHRPLVGAHSRLSSHSDWIPASRALHIRGRYARQHPGYRGQGTHEISPLHTAW